MTSSESSAGSTTRRKLLGWGGLGTLGGLAVYLGWSRTGDAPPHVQASATPMPKPAPAVAQTVVKDEPVAAASTSLFEREAFVPHVRSEFTIIHEGDDSASCRLLEVSPETRISSGKQNYTSFTLLFEADSFFLREGGICRVKHAKMGEMQFFLSPVGKSGRKALLEAAFTLAV